MISIIQQIDEKSKKELREKLLELYGYLSVKQKNFFKKMYRCPVDELPFEKVRWAITQCVNTLKGKYV